MATPGKPYVTSKTIAVGLVGLVVAVLARYGIIIVDETEVALISLAMIALRFVTKEPIS